MGNEKQSQSIESPARNSESISTGKERIDRENANRLSIKVSMTVGDKFDKKDLPFDKKAMESFKERISKAIEQVFLNPNIPDVTKEKFKQHLLKKIDDFTNVSVSDIAVMKNRRIAGSLGVEAYELRDKSENEKQAYFLGKILDETIAKEVEPVAYSLVQAFSPEKVQHPTMKDVSYDRANHERFVSGIRNADGILGLSVFDRTIAPLSGKIDISKMNVKFNVGTELMKELSEKGYRVKDAEYFKNLVQRTSSLGEGVRKSDRREGETTIVDAKGNPILKDGKPVDGVDLLLAYFAEIDQFQGTEREIRDTKELAGSDGIASKAKELVGMNQLKTEFEYLKPDDIEARMKGKSFADMMIICTQLVQLYPGAGDVVGGIDGLADACSGRNIDGVTLNGIEKGLAGIFGILGITVVGGFALRAYNAGKMEKLIRSFKAIQKILPEKFEEFLKTGGKLTEQAKTGIIAFGKMMGEEVAKQIEGIMKRQGLIMGFTPEMRQFSQVFRENDLVVVSRSDGSKMIGQFKGIDPKTGNYMIDLPNGERIGKNPRFITRYNPEEKVLSGKELPKNLPELEKLLQEKRRALAESMEIKRSPSMSHGQSLEKEEASLRKEIEAIEGEIRTKKASRPGETAGEKGRSSDFTEKNGSKGFLESLNKLPKTEIAQRLVEDISFNSKTLIEIGGFKGIFSRVVQSGSRYQVVALVENGGKIEARMFYKSNSDGIWRATSGRRVGQQGGYSKLESVEDNHYIATAKIDSRLEQHLNNITKQQGGVFEEKSFLKEYFNGDFEKGTFYGALHHEAQTEISPFGSKSMKKHGLMDQDFQPGNWQQSGLTGRGLLDRFRNQEYPPGFLPDFSKGPIRRLNSDTSFAGPTTIFVFQGVLEGRKVEWHMAVSNLEKKVWIDGIIPSGSGVSSFGTSKEFINTGFLTSKPFEYGSQLPPDLIKGKKPMKVPGQEDDAYYDITNELREIKPVKDFVGWLRKNGINA